MILLFTSFFASLFACGLLIRYKDWHLHYSADHKQNGPQKFHQIVTPRIGGIGIIVGYLTALISNFFINFSETKSLIFVLLAAFPVFIAGITEDLTKRVGIMLRLIVAFLSALLFLLLFEINSLRLDIILIDSLMNYRIVVILFLTFAIAGLCNAYNIIDGFNGLASMIGIISITAILYVAMKVQDPLVMALSLIAIGSVAGFFVWNYPKGLVFLGDGGAYFIGFMGAVTSILLVTRNPLVSPWFAILVNVYPIFETLFTIWRRTVHKGRNPTQPDGAHFHSLIYRRIMRWVNHNGKNNQYMNNSKTSPYLWLLSSLGVVPAIIWWNKTNFLMVASVLFIIIYVYLYFRIVKFKTPGLINYRARPK